MLKPKRRNAMEQALARPSPIDQLRTLPGFVDTCHWYECEEPAPRGLRNVTMRKVSSAVWRALKRVPLCDVHMARVMMTKQLTLKYELDDVPEDWLVPLPGVVERPA